MSLWKREVLRGVFLCTLAFAFIFMWVGQVHAVDFSDGLVTCGNDVQTFSKTVDGVNAVCTVGECTVCDIQVMLLRLVDFFMIIASVVFGYVLLYTGIQLLRFGANPSALKKAKGMFFNAVIGFVVFLTAYLIVDTIMKTLYAEDGGANWGPWKSFLCKNKDGVASCVKKIDTAHLVGVIYEPHIAGPEYKGADFVYDRDLAGFILSDDAYARGADALSNPSKCATAAGTCRDIIMREANAQGVDPNFAIAIATIESAGNPKALSGKNAVGLMQLLPSTARLLCGAECAGKSDAEMKQWLYNPENNARVGVKYLKEGMNNARVKELAGGDAKKTIMYTAARYNGGPNALKPSESCPDLTWFECTKNPRYAETRAYVKKVFGKI